MDWAPPLMIITISIIIRSWSDFQHRSCPNLMDAAAAAAEPERMLDSRCWHARARARTHSPPLPHPSTPSSRLSPLLHTRTQNALSWRLPTMLPPPTVAGGPSQPWTRTARSQQQQQTARSARNRRRSPNPSTKTGSSCTTGRSRSPPKRYERRRKGSRGCLKMEVSFLTPLCMIWCSRRAAFVFSFPKCY